MRLSPLVIPFLASNPGWMLYSVQAQGTCRSLLDGSTPRIDDCCSGQGTGSGTVSGNIFEYKCGKEFRRGAQAIFSASAESAQECANRCVLRGCTAAIYSPADGKCYYTRDQSYTFQDAPNVLSLAHKGEAGDGDCTDKINEAIAQGKEKCDEEKREQTRECNARCEEEKREQTRECNARCEEEKREQTRDCNDRISQMDRELTRCRQNNTELAELIRNSQEGLWVDYAGWPGQAVTANAVAFSPANAEQMATAQTNGDIYVWNVKTARPVYSWNTGGAGMGTSLSWSRDGTKLLCGTLHGTVKIWDTTTGTDHVFLQESSQRMAIQVAMSPDGKTAAAGLDDGRVLLWDVAQKRLIQTQGHTRTVGGLAFSTGSLVSGSMDRTIRFWNVKSGALEAEIRDLVAGVRTVAFSPDGKSFASGLDDNSVRIWNSGTRTQRRDLRGHTSRVNHVAFSSDGRQLASTSDDGSVRIWSLTDDYALGTFGQRKAKSVSFSSDGKFLAGLGELTPLRLWQKVPA